MKNSGGFSLGFSLIEILVFMGILSMLVAGVFFIGFPEYDRYIISSERDYLVDTLLESRARSLVGGAVFAVSIWSNGYCIKDASGLCVVPAHDLPGNMTLASVSSATSTKMVLAFTNAAPGSMLQAEVNIDQNGFIFEQ